MDSTLWIDVGTRDQNPTHAFTVKPNASSTVPQEPTHFNSAVFVHGTSLEDSALHLKRVEVPVVATRIKSTQNATMLRSCSSVALFSSLLFLQLPSWSFAWGTIGHEIVANVAWRLLSNETQAWAKEILEWNDTTVEDDNNNSPLGAVADWADRVRHFLPWSAPLHYIDVRDDLFLPEGGCHVAPHLNPQCHFDYARDCPKHTCVAGAIVNYTHQLLAWKGNEAGKLRPSMNGKATHTQVRSIPKAKEALMFLVHFIGDIHQPLHCSRTTDKGGNDFHVHFTPLPPTFLDSNIRLGRRLDDERSPSSLTTHHHGWNLHSVWDTGLIDVALERNYNQSRTLLEDSLWQELTSKKNFNRSNYLNCDDSMGANRTCTSLWGQESWSNAIRFAYTLDDNVTDVKNGATLDDGYYETRWPLAKERLAAGAVRLAATLEWIVQQRPDAVRQKHLSLATRTEGKSEKRSLLEWLASWNDRMMLRLLALFKH